MAEKNEAKIRDMFNLSEPKKAFEQLVASYVKVRGILQSIEGYNPADYEEMGLVVSYPPTGGLSIPATSVIGIKKAVIAPSYMV